MERRHTRSCAKKAEGTTERMNCEVMNIPGAGAGSGGGDVDFGTCTDEGIGVQNLVPEGTEEHAGASKVELLVQKVANLNKRKRIGKEKDYEKDMDCGTDSDDDFVSTKEDRKVLRRCDASNIDVSRKRVMETELNVLQTRSSPRLLVRAIKAMNNAQKKAVQEIGFGGLLNLEISQLPSKMAFWVVENFNPRNCTLRLQEGHNVHISDEDVARVFGLPMGATQIVPQENHEPCNILKEWRAMFKKGGRKITPADISDAMLLCEEGDIWFVRHFVVLVVTVIFDSGANGYAHPLIMNNLENESKIKGLNWCRYVISCLIENKLSWEKNKKTAFNGPLLFLMMVYVDRVVLYQRTIERKLPVIIGWNAHMLRERENAEIEAGGFGSGYVDDPLQLIGSDDSGIGDDEPKVHVRMFAEKSSCIAELVNDIITIANEDPACIMEKESMNKLQEAGEKLIAFAKKKDTTQQQMENDAISEEHGGNGVEIDDDVFWSHPTTLAILEKAEKNGVKVGMTNKNTSPLPSFSIGLTQQERDADLERQRPKEMGGPLNTNKEGFEDRVCTEEDETEEVHIGKEEGAYRLALVLRGNVQNNVDITATREKRQQKMAEVLKSPYLLRAIDHVQMCTSMEKSVMAWLLNRSKYFLNMKNLRLQ
ncbi:unnamed protein product [Cuscuta europaea]|uniref:Uncharacterized protein n=1 Tax=Cuscuta europaea TaxID=41803 RepID=A0A9P0YGL7_CUSEU|nr:unnamed protein product [Cuscuta europaea]